MGPSCEPTNDRASAGCDQTTDQRTAAIETNDQRTASTETNDYAKWLGDKDSNLDSQIQKLASCH